MDTPPLLARQQFLDSASQSLVFSSPHISAHLKSIQNGQLKTLHPKANTNESYVTCSACGNALLSGVTGKIDGQKPFGRKRTRSDRLSLNSATKPIRTQCSVCNSVTKIDLPRPQITKSRRIQRAVDKIAPGKPIHPSGRVETEKLLSTTVTTSSGSATKKRNRSKNSSLQDMLAKRKLTEAAPRKGLGMDWMDFMKT